MESSTTTTPAASTENLLRCDSCKREFHHHHHHHHHHHVDDNNPSIQKSASCSHCICNHCLDQIVSVMSKIPNTQQQQQQEEDRWSASSKEDDDEVKPWGGIISRIKFNIDDDDDDEGDSSTTSTTKGGDCGNTGDDDDSILTQPEPPTHDPVLTVQEEQQGGNHHQHHQTTATTTTSITRAEDYAGGSNTSPPRPPQPSSSDCDNGTHFISCTCCTAPRAFSISIFTTTTTPTATAADTANTTITDSEQLNRHNAANPEINWGGGRDANNTKHNIATSNKNNQDSVDMTECSNSMHGDKDTGATTTTVQPPQRKKLKWNHQTTTTGDIDAGKSSVTKARIETLESIIRKGRNEIEILRKISNDYSDACVNAAFDNNPSTDYPPDAGPYLSRLRQFFGDHVLLGVKSDDEVKFEYGVRRMIQERRDRLILLYKDLKDLTSSKSKKGGVREQQQDPIGPLNEKEILFSLKQSYNDLTSSLESIRAHFCPEVLEEEQQQQQQQQQQENDDEEIDDEETDEEEEDDDDDTGNDESNFNTPPEAHLLPEPINGKKDKSGGVDLQAVAGEEEQVDPSHHDSATTNTTNNNNQKTPPRELSPPPHTRTTETIVKHTTGAASATTTTAVAPKSPHPLIPNDDKTAEATTTTLTGNPIPTTTTTLHHHHCDSISRPPPKQQPPEQQQQTNEINTPNKRKVATLQQPPFHHPATAGQPPQNKKLKMDFPPVTTTPVAAAASAITTTTTTFTAPAGDPTDISTASTSTVTPSNSHTTLTTEYVVVSRSTGDGRSADNKPCSGECFGCNKKAKKCCGMNLGWENCELVRKNHSSLPPTNELRQKKYDEHATEKKNKRERIRKQIERAQERAAAAEARAARLAAAAAATGRPTEGIDVFAGGKQQQEDGDNRDQLPKANDSTTTVSATTTGASNPTAAEDESMPLAPDSEPDPGPEPEPNSDLSLHEYIQGPLDHSQEHCLLRAHWFVTQQFGHSLPQQELHKKIANYFDSRHFGLLELGKVGGLGGRIPLATVAGFLKRISQPCHRKVAIQLQQLAHHPTVTTPVLTRDEILKLGRNKARNECEKRKLGLGGNVETLQKRLLEYYGHLT